MELPVQSLSKNSETGTVQLSDAVFAQHFNESLIHQVITAYLAKARAGTRAHKTRSEVRGGGAKPFRQKGTGRARAGTIRSPLWRGGGKVFAAKPGDYSQKVNKKMYRAAMRSILSELVRQDRLRMVDKIILSKPKTKDLAKLLKSITWRNVLVVVAEDDRNLELSARNIPTVAISNVGRVSPVELIRFDGVLITEDAIRCFEGGLT
ncbi:50S ribosomal protein L4 [Nitrosococcus watsonii]|uniref:Large ribosomal subunit protein uL4 n=1 Tax=Nitrosococcus watsoni (strain C-113) TaxID=105559 RepID=D8K7W2_NITWC|nr:50S ribosomal protein L4 [Nitrosococcus watsonii]ADJ28989.1 ribosomal protein L4/L1e [Nitrosococcus watsonii C-113]